MTAISWEVEQDSFTAAVRGGKILHPAQRGFSEPRWKAAYSGYPNPTDVDERLFEAGLYFHLRLSEVREAVSAMRSSPLAIETRLRLLVGWANYEVLAAEKNLNQSLGPSVKDTVRFAAMNGWIKSADAVISGLIDGLRYPLAAESRKKIDPSASRATATELLDEIALATHLGHLYNALEESWSYCLWRGWHVQKHDRVNFIVPLDVNLEEKKAVGDFRFHTLMKEQELLTWLAWKRATPAERSAVSSVHRVTAITRGGKRKPRRLELGVGDPADPTNADRMLQHALDGYTEPLAQRSSAALAGLRVTDLMAAWYVLAPIEELLFADIGIPPEIASATTLAQFAPVLARSELERVLGEALGFSEAQAARTIELLTFRDDHRIDLWTRPFVDLGSADIAVLKSVLSGTNLNRLVVNWIQEADFSLGERGPRWENEVRQFVSRGIKLPNATVLDRSFSFRVEGNEEEIDFLAAIGNTVLVGEAKCSLLPVNPVEHTRFVSVLDGGAKQARRKAQLIEKYPHEFAKQIEWPLTASLSAVPFVVTNQSIGVGHEFEGVPVIDRWILADYFKKGTLSPWVHEAGLKFVETGPVTPFYSDPSEAEKNVAAYLRDPPQLAVARASLEIKSFPLPSFSNPALAAWELVPRVSIPPVWLGVNEPPWLTDLRNTQYQARSPTTSIDKLPPEAVPELCPHTRETPSNMRGRIEGGPSVTIVASSTSTTINEHRDQPNSN